MVHGWVHRFHYFVDLIGSWIRLVHGFDWFTDVIGPWMSTSIRLVRRFDWFIDERTRWWIEGLGHALIDSLIGPLIPRSSYWCGAMGPVAMHLDVTLLMLGCPGSWGEGGACQTLLLLAAHSSSGLENRLQTTAKMPDVSEETGDGGSRSLPPFSGRFAR